MMKSGRPSGFTPWRIVRTQSASVYRATTPAGEMFGERTRMLPVRRIDEKSSGAVGRMAIAASARCKEILAARQRRFVAADGHALDFELDDAIAFAIEQQIGGDRQPDADHHEEYNQTADPLE